GQRHRPFAPGRGAGPAGSRAVYLHQGSPDRALWRRNRSGGIAHLGPGQLRETLPSPGMHDRADAISALAGPARGLQAMGKQQPVRLILASGSPARRELLTSAGYQFEVLPANIDEPTDLGSLDIRGYVHHVAWLKAAAIAPKVSDGIILAADT